MEVTGAFASCRAATSGTYISDGASSASPKELPLGSSVAYPSGSLPATSRASEAPLACSPLEATSTISSPGARSSPRIGPRPAGRAPTAAPASSMSCSSSSPRSDRDSLALRVPLRGAGGEVRVDHERQGPHAAEIVEDRRHGVIGDVGETVDALAFEHVPGDDRLRAQPLDDEGKRLPAQLEHECGLPARGVERAPAPGLQERRRRQGLGHGQSLAGVERVVVNPGRTVAGALIAHPG